MAKMKKKLRKSYRSVSEAEPFVIKSPAWCTYACLGVAVACLIGIICIWSQKEDFVKMVEGGDITGWILLLSLILAAALVGLYMCLYEKMTYCDGVYGYYKAFKKNQFARVEDIKLAELITVDVWGNRGVRTHYKVYFYGENDEILLNFLDDGTIFNNEVFRESLRSNGIKCKNKKIEKNNF